MKIFHRTFYDTAWQIKIQFVVCDSEVALNKFLKRKFGHDLEDEPEDRFQGRSVNFENENGVLVALIRWKKNPKGLSVLAHECFHAVEYIMERRDTVLSADTSEAWAYLLDSIFFRCLTSLK